ncbi:DeoR/GlpR family DNA-binding transcription regulator [Brachybacterium huguangmaarense]
MVTPPLAAPPVGIPLSGSGKRSRRMLAILDLLSERGDMSVDHLVQAMGTSPATVRRDIADLDRQGMLTRVPGGARPRPAAGEVPVRLRATRFPGRKLRIAQVAAALLPKGPGAIALGGGTTTAAVADTLVSRDDLTVVTNSLSIAHAISMHPNLRVIMTGGVVRSCSYELVGRLAEHAFTAMNIGTAILGADGVSARGGITTHDDIEAQTNAAMFRSAQRRVVVADSSKIGLVTLAQVAAIEEIDDLVTDAAADPRTLAELRAAGCRVHVVAEGGAA